MRNLELIKKKDYDTLIKENEKLIIYLINKNFKNRKDGDFEEMLQAGRIAIFESAKTYDETKNVKFSTYAANNIINAIKTYLTHNRNYEFAVKLPRDKITFLNKIQRKDNNFKQLYNREPNYIDLDITYEEYEEYRYLSDNFNKERLNFTSEDDNSDMLNIKIPKVYDKYNLDDCEFDFTIPELQEAFETLTEKEKLVIIEICVHGNTNAYIGEKLNLSKQRINQIYKTGCEKIKNKLGRNIMEDLHLTLKK